MLVGGNALAHVVRFAIELALVLLGQMAVVLRHVPLFISSAGAVRRARDERFVRASADRSLLRLRSGSADLFRGR